MVAARPHVQIRVIDGVYETLLARLRSGEIDFLIGALRHPPPADDVAQERLFDDPLTIVAGAHHPLAGRRNVSIAETLDWPWVAPPRPTPAGSYLFDTLKIQEREQTPVRVVSSSLALLRGLLEQHARDRGVEGRVRFLGWRDDVGALLAAADVLVCPSRHEPLGNVVLEAWHAGVPVVSTRSEGPSWFATDEKDALMVDIDAIDQMTAALNRIRTDRTLAANLVKGGHATLEAGFTRQQVVDQYLAIFRGEF